MEIILIALHLHFMTTEQVKIAQGLAAGKNTRTISAELGISMYKVSSGLVILKSEFNAVNGMHLIAILMRKKIIK